ncbi:MAG: carbohydrate kinase [Polyangia bacterium]
MKIPQGEIDFLGVGELLVDFISTEETDWLLNAYTFRKYQGGSPSNIAVNIAKLGGTSAVAAKTGIGAMGKFLKAELQRAGVCCDYLVMDHRVNTSGVFVSRNTRTADSEAFRSGDYQLDPEEIRREAVERARVVHASTWALSREPCRSAVAHAFELASRMDKIISFDPNYNPSIWPEYREALPVIEAMLGCSTIVKASRDDARRIFGRNRSDEQYVERLHEAGPQIVVFTMGSDGVLLSRDGEMVRIPAHPVDVADATGAGDSFWAGFLVALLDGNELERCTLFAREVAERKLQIVGPLPNNLDRDEIYAAVERAGTILPVEPSGT